MPRDDQETAPFAPQEGGQAMVYRSREDEAPYPDMVYQAESEAEEENGESAPAEEAVYSYSHPLHRKKQPFRFLWVLLILLSAAALSGMGVYVFRLYSAYAPFRQRVGHMRSETFAQGVTVDQVPIGGMTRSQAEAALGSRSSQTDGQLWITVIADTQTFVITPNELPLERNIPSVLNTAYAVGRQGIRETVGTDITPFEYRYAHLLHTAQNPVSLFTTVTYDPEKVLELVNIIESKVNRQPVDAQLASFDSLTRSFTIADEVSGVELDAKDLYDQLIAALNRKDYTARIQARTEPVLPRITKAELMNSFTLLSSFTTMTTQDANRNQNISLVCRAVNHTLVMPGETFSLNAATGERTKEKGYLPALTIQDEEAAEEADGGASQVATTLFNAAAMANLTVLNRAPCPLPPDFVEMGRDASLRYPDQDLRFRNDTALPIFIVSDYQQNLCTVEIYGAAMEIGVSIQLETVVSSVQEPSGEPNYEFNAQLQKGTIREKKKARTGYTVETYKVFMKNGRELRRELLCTSVYDMVQRLLEYNN